MLAIVEDQQYLAPPAHLVHLDVQEIQDQDRPGLQVQQVMEDQGLKETEGNPAFHPAQERLILDRQDHLGLSGLEDHQVLLDQEDTKVKQGSQVCREPQGDQGALREYPLMVEDSGPLDLQVRQDFLEYRESKGTLELLVVMALREAPSQSPQAPPALQVLPALQVRRAPSLLLLRCGSTSLNI